METNNKEWNLSLFKDYTSKITYKGFNEFLNYLTNETDFFTAPASTKYHLSVPGGLLRHSLNVCTCLLYKSNNPLWRGSLKNLSEGDLIFAALFHDICKVNTYVPSTRNVKVYDEKRVKEAPEYKIKTDALGKFFWETIPSYEFNDNNPLGHGEKSVIMILKYIKEIPDDVIYAIRWHMGYTKDDLINSAINNAIEKYPLVLALQEADMEAAHVMEKEEKNV